MIQLIIDNKEWIFSGIGVAIIIGLIKFLLSRKSGQQQSIKAGNSSTNIQTGNGASVTVLTNNKSTIAPPHTVKPLKIDDRGGIICTTRINEGDYQEFIWGVRTVRITVLEIVKKKFHLSDLRGEKDMFGALLEISTGGG